MNNALEYLESTVSIVPNKVAFLDETISVTFEELYNNGRAIGSFLHHEGFDKEPVIVFMKKSPKSILSFLGVVYSGCYYVPLDEEMPIHRIELILENLNPRAIICDEHTRGIVDNLAYNESSYLYDDIITTEVDEVALNDIRCKMIDIDPLYVVFTSGSTGVPKGVVGCHRAVIDYIENLTNVLEIDKDTVFGLQSPLYFDACLKEIYPTLKYGASCVMIPKKNFMFPIKLVEFLNEYKVNTICWVVSALTMISSLKTFDKLIPEHLHTIAFGSEVFPIKQFNLWRSALPNATFFNLYGPTEATGMSCYYKINREFTEDQVIPVGKSFKNTRILLLKDDNSLCETGETGEICITGTCITLGYYNNIGKTDEVFVQNPVSKLFNEIIYRTGDLGKYNEYDELVFVSRKDYQIKHMGHRIELGEIEANVNTLEGINSACCIYIKEKDFIILNYVGDIERKEVRVKLKDLLPVYMLPNKIIKLEQMPLTANGKIDRKSLSSK